jgi:hypothetical protein
MQIMRFSIVPLRDSLTRLGRAADGRIGQRISPRYNLIGVIFNLTAVFIFKLLRLCSQLASYVGAYSSERRTFRGA